MSIPVEIDDLEEAIDNYGVNAYLITTDSKSHPHITHITLSTLSYPFICNIGRKTAANVLARPSVAMLWPPVSPGDYSLIVDGMMQVEENPEGSSQGVFKPKSAILHRSALNQNPDMVEGCSSDCHPVTSEKK